MRDFEGLMQGLLRKADSYRQRGITIPEHTNSMNH